MKAESLLFLVLGVNLLATVSYFFIITSEKLKECFYNLPVFIQKSYVLLFVVPLFISPFLKQSTFVSWFLVEWIGLLLSFSGVIFILFSFFKIGVVPSISRSELVSSGMYRVVRHPIYSGTLFLFLGLILVKSAMIPLLYFPVSLFLYYQMTLFEEKDLVGKFGGEYVEYTKKVKFRVIPFVL